MNLPFQKINILLLCFLIQLLFIEALISQNNIQHEILKANKVEGFNRHIGTVIQDKHGFLWLGSWHGIKKFDGRNIEWFKPSTKRKWSIPGRKIYDLKEDNSNRVWIGSYKGLMVYEKETNRFFTFPEYSGLEYTFSNTRLIYIDKNENIWLGTRAGVFVISETLDRNFEVQKIPKTDNISITEIVSDDQNIFWLGGDSGIVQVQYDGHKNIKNVQLIRNKELEQVNSYVTKLIFEKKESALYVSTNRNVLKFRVNSDSLIELKNWNKVLTDEQIPGIKRIWKLKNDSLLYVGGTKNIYGLWKGKIKKEITFNENKDFKTIVVDIIKDNYGNTWFASANGLFKLSAHPPLFKDFTSESRKLIKNEKIVVSGILVSNRKLFVTTHEHGLIIADVIENKYDNFKLFTFGDLSLDESLLRIRRIYKDSQERIWIATKEPGLFIGKIDENGDVKIVPAQDLYPHLSKPDFGEVFSMTELPNKDIMMGTWKNGLYHFSENMNLINKYKNFSDKAVDDFDYPITKILPESDKVIWIGTRGSGVFKVDLSNKKPSINNINVKQNLLNTISDDYISDIAVDHLGGMWIGTENGLNLYDRKSGKFLNIEESDGLPDNLVHGILVDNNGEIWIPTNNGLAKINPMNASIEKGSIDEIKTYTTGSGFSSNEFAFQAYHLTFNGEMLFGTDKGFCKYSLDARSLDSFSSQTSPIILKKLYINQEEIFPLEEFEGRVLLNKAIDYTSSIHLKPNENNITIEFGVISFQPEEHTKFAYRIKGASNDWYYTDYKNPKAAFTNFVAGEYVFELKATNPDGTWSDAIRRLVIHKEAPFWKTTVAYIIYILFALLLFLLVLKAIRFRYKLKAKIELEEYKRIEVEESYQEKLRFFINISHELKTPLTLILGPIENVVKEIKNLDHKNLVNIAIRNARRLKELVEQILEFRKAEASELKLKVAKYQLNELIESIYNDFLYLAEQKDLELTLSKENIDDQVWLDYDKVRKVIYNLLSNAIKNTPKGGKIVLLCELKPFNEFQLAFKCTITDTGIGIPFRELENIFTRFYQVNPYGGGMGIGLALSKKLVEMHKGNIDVDSKQGEGSSFTFWIPVSENDYLKTEKCSFSDVIPQKVEEPVNLLRDEILFDEKSNKPILLIVEDEVEINDFIKAVFFESFNIIQAFNGKEALDKISKKRPALIITDLMMPKMDGIELIKKLKQKHKTEEIPIILLTAYDDKEQQRKVWNAGADLFISKPFDNELLKIQALSLINQRNLVKKHLQQEDATKIIKELPIDKTYQNKIIKIINENIDNDKFNVNLLADKMFLSRAQLYRKTKEEFKMTPVELIRKTRLKYAAKLIKELSANVSESAYQSGFSDLQYFRDCFKKEFGVTPSDYKKGLH